MNLSCYSYYIIKKLTGSETCAQCNKIARIHLCKCIMLIDYVNSAYSYRCRYRFKISKQFLFKRDLFFDYRNHSCAHFRRDDAYNSVSYDRCAKPPIQNP